MKQFFRKKYTWQSVYYYKKCSKDNSWERVWYIISEKHRNILDIRILLDGTHTPIIRAGQTVACQDRKEEVNKVCCCKN